jgi:hypothetical protein
VCEAGLEAARSACSAAIAVQDYIVSTGDVCEPGTRLHHNIVYPAAGAGGFPQTERPQSDDQVDVEVCAQYIFNDPTETWEESFNSDQCIADSVWHCIQGSWISGGGDDCGEAIMEPPCSN